METLNIEISYKELRKGIPKFENDEYQIAAYYSEARKETFLNNPFLREEDEIAYIFPTVDGKIVGRNTHFPILVRIGNEIVNCISCSALEVHKDYRKFAIGADLMCYPVFKDKREFVIAAGISEQALPMYKKLRYHILNYDRFLMIRNFKPIFIYKGIPKFMANISVPILNALGKGYYNLFSKKKAKDFKIKEIKKIPKSIDKISLDDKYQFMEVHDHKWLQWNLDYNFTVHPFNKKKFFIIYDENDVEIGFFMLKETFRETAGELKNVKLGSIIEWGSTDESRLSEFDIYRMALPYFSKDIDLIEVASADTTIGKKLRKLGFLKFRQAHIIFKDKKKQYPESKNIANWRIRLGYADVAFT